MARYKPNTHDIVKDSGERAYWLGVLRDAIPVSVDKACLSEERSPGTLSVQTPGCPVCTQTGLALRANSCYFHLLCLLAQQR